MIADSHNGGKAVRQIKGPDGRIWFEKPRTVFWERLFFGVDSPIKECFSKSRAIFNLQVEETLGLAGGRSLLVQRSDETDLDTLTNFGYLLGYCYAFGIQDLFADNLVRTKYGVQPIDAEAVLSRFTLPHESALLPFKNIGFERCGLGCVIQSRSTLFVEELTQLLDGFSEALNDTSRTSPILENLSSETELKRAPIRVLLRPTVEYLGLADIVDPLIPEEREQLAVNDVPYFFKYLGDDSLYFYRRDIRTAVASPLSSRMTKGLGKLATDPALLLDPDRISKELLPVGSLYLIRALLPKSFTGSFSTRYLTAEILPESIRINIAGSLFSCRRF